MERNEEIEKWIEWEKKTKVFLYDKILISKNYDAIQDHDHCELCWARFGKCGDDLKKGYFEPESKNWICEECFQEFKDIFRWKVNNM